MHTNRKAPASARRQRAQRGSTLIESAICFLGFLVLCLGLMEFSMAVYAYNFCTYGAQDAARYAALHGSHSPEPVTADGVRSYVQSRTVALDSSRLVVNTTWMPDNNPGSKVKVEVRYNAVPLVGLALRQNLQMSGFSQVAVLH